MTKSIYSVSKKTNILITTIMSIIAVSCVLPYVLSIVISLTSEEYLLENGFSLFIAPSNISFDVYSYLFLSWEKLVNAYIITIIVTVIGTLTVLFITLTLGYVLSRKSFKYRKSLTFFIFITMIFNAGLTANYMVMTQFLQLDDTIWALIIPLVVNPFWIFIARTYFVTSIPDSIIEASIIDGAGELKIFRSVVLPLSLPVAATIGLFSTLAYWNDWFNAKLYIENPRLDTLQYFLVRLEENVNYLKDNASSLGAYASEVAASLPDETLMMGTMVIATLPLALAYPFFQKYFVSGLTIGSIK